MSNRIREAFQRAWLRTERRQYVDGLLGRHNADGSVTYVPTGRKLYKYVTIRQSNGAQTAVPARDDVGVPHSTDLPVRMRLENTTYIIEKIIRREDLASVDAPPASGVPIHLHTLAGLSDVRVTDPADGEILEWDATSSKFVNVTNTSDIAATIHAATGKTTPVDADELALVDSAASNALKKLTWANVKATLKTYFDTLYDKTATIITALSTKTTPVDADAIVITDSAASDAPKRVTYTNVKAFLKTYFDTLYNLYVHPNHTGDVTSVGDGATTIAADAVTNAKLANMATATVKGRTTAGTGDPEDLTMAQLVALIEAQVLYALLAGRSGGQTLYGGVNSGDALKLSGSSNATKGGVRVIDDKLMVGADIAPDTTMEVVDSGTASTRGFITGQHNSGAQAALFIFRKSRGSRSSPSVVSNGDNIGAFYGQAYDGASYLQTAGIGYKITGTVSSGSVPTDILFGTGAVDSANFTNERMRIASAGQLLVGVSSGNANVLGVKAGTSSNDAAVGGVLYVTTTQTGNVGTGTDDIASYAVPANTLAVNGQSLWFEASGSVANNANSKTLQIVFGGTTLGSWTFTTNQADDWVIRGRVFRTGATTQKNYISLNARFASQPLNDVTTAAETLSGSVNLKAQGIGTSNNDIVCETFIVGWCDTNS